MNEQPPPSDRPAPPRRPYKKPSLEIVTVNLEEVMMASCKIDSGPLNGCGSCSDAGGS